MAQQNWPDRSIEEGDQIVTQSKEGFRVKRTFTCSKLDNTDPLLTLYNAIISGDWIGGHPETDVPIRMAPHPSIVIPSAWAAYYDGLGKFAENNCLCADVFTIKSLTSTQAILEVEYAPLNAITQEPTEDGDSAPAFLEVGSSVHSMKLPTDLGGTRIVIPYSGSYTIEQNGNTIAASNAISAEVQIPTKLFRFVRRERQIRAAVDLEGFVNQDAMVIPLGNGHVFTAAAQTLLCTRVENQSRDEGLSQIVTYEFQWLDWIQGNSNNQYVSPAIDPSGGAFAISAWQLYALYTLPNGTVGDNGSGSIIGPNQTPSDAKPYIFQIYPLKDFSTLSLF